MRTIRSCWYHLITVSQPAQVGNQSKNISSEQFINSKGKRVYIGGLVDVPSSYRA